MRYNQSKAAVAKAASRASHMKSQCESMDLMERALSPENFSSKEMVLIKSALRLTQNEKLEESAKRRISGENNSVMNIRRDSKEHPKL